MTDAYWENGAYAEIEEAPAGFNYLLRFDGWHIERKNITESEAKAAHLHFLKSHAAFGPMSPERQKHIEGLL